MAARCLATAAGKGPPGSTDLHHVPVSEMAGSDPIHPLVRSFVHTLRDLGYVEGRNLVLSVGLPRGNLNASLTSSGSSFPSRWMSS